MNANRRLLPSPHAARFDCGFGASLVALSSLLSGFLLFFIGAATGAHGDEPRVSTGIYTPNNAVQAAPMRVTVIDGTTFKDIETGAVYRLYGIDACAKGQTAALGRQSWPCGVMATAWLVNATLGKWTACNVLDEIDTVKFVRCATSEHPDLAADMLKDGDALTNPDKDGRKIHAYVEAEDAARKAYKGLWSSRFEFPWEFRKAQPQVHAGGASIVPQTPKAPPLATGDQF